MLTISKRIPARTKTLRIRQYKKDFTHMSESYRRIRGNMRNPGFNCYWCGHEFEMGEMIAIILPEKERNRVFCQSCAEQIQEENK